MTVNLSLFAGAGWQFFDANGVPLAGGNLYVYEAGTTVPATTYTALAATVAHTNPLVLDAAGRVTEEIWLTEGAAYKFVLKDALFNLIGTWDNIWGANDFSTALTQIYAAFAAPTGSNLVGYKLPTALSEATTVQKKIASTSVTVFDFMTQAQIDDVIAGTKTIDVTAPIQNAIDYVSNIYGSIGEVLFPAGDYKISATLIVEKPIYLKGAGHAHSTTAPGPQTRIHWAGTTGNMLEFGSRDGTTNIIGGGISRMIWYGNGVATRIWKMMDCQFARFDDCRLESAVDVGWWITNTVSIGYPTGMFSVDNVQIMVNFLPATLNAHGLLIEAGLPVPVSPAGVTMCTFNRLWVEHANGAGVKFIGGDNHLFNRLFCYRPDSATGAGVWHAGTPANSTTESANTFISPACSGGFQVDDPGDRNDCITVINNDDLEAVGQYTLFGNGMNRCNMTTHSGRVFGQHKTLGYRESIMHDAMKFIKYGTNVLQTAQGNWFTTGAVTDATQPGGAVSIATSGVINNIAAIYNAATMGVSGVSVEYKPHLIAAVTVLDTTKTVSRFGYMDSITDPPTNGIYVEVDPTEGNPWWRAVCKDATGRTEVTAAGPGLAVAWRIEIQANCANFYYRTSSSADEGFVFFASITTHVPGAAVKLDIAFQVKALDAAVRTLFVYDVKQGYQTEV